MANTLPEHRVSEFEDVQSIDPLRQGDVVVDVSGSSDAAAYIVVTADCDLTHNKYGRWLTALPVLSLDRYLRDFWIERELRTQREHLAARVQEEMRRLIAMSAHNFPEPTQDRLIEWPLASSIDELSSTLQMVEEDLKELSELVAVVRRIDRSENLSLQEKWRTCTEAMFCNNIKSHERARAALVKRVSRELPRQLPGDILYLNRPFASADAGYVALVRFPVQIDPGNIARAPADLVYDAVSYRRVSRLTSPYRYRLTQLLADVYAAIGLPDDYEVARSEQFEKLAQRIDNELWP